MMTDVLLHFTKLDELIQTVYQGFDRFVVLSHVEELAWTIHLALKGPAEERNLGLNCQLPFNTATY